MSAGYCECGCGERAPAAKRSRPHLGHVKGEPVRFVHGHSGGLPRVDAYEVRDCGYDTPCWVWLGDRAEHGYGRISFHGRKDYAHRIYYERHVGPIPAGADVDHLCENRACVNPTHLRACTRAEHLARHAALRRAA